MDPIDYWEECLCQALESVGVHLTPEQLAEVAGSIESAHDNYGLAFYSPPSTDRIAEIERVATTKLKEAERRFEKYRDNAEEAVKRALRQRSDAQVSIEGYGQVFRHGGRTEQIQ